MENREQQCIEILCNHFEIEKEKLYIPSKVNYRVGYAKKLLCKWYVEVFGINKNQTKVRLNFVTHTSVLHNIKKANIYLEVYEDMQQLWNQLIKL